MWLSAKSDLPLVDNKVWSKFTNNFIYLHFLWYMFQIVKKKEIESDLGSFVVNEKKNVLFSLDFLWPFSRVIFFLSIFDILCFHLLIFTWVCTFLIRWFCHALLIKDIFVLFFIFLVGNSLFYYWVKLTIMVVDS